MPGAKAPDPEYIAARRVLLDAFEALGTQRKAVVLVGAQAIYLQAGEANLAVSPYTTDGDLSTHESSTTNRSSGVRYKLPVSNSRFAPALGA